MEIDKSLRTLLFVPGDSRGKLAKSQLSQADALIVDWEDAVAPQNKAEARVLTLEFLRRRAMFPQMIILRLNPVFSPAFQEDCAILDQCTVDGIMLSKCRTADDVCRLEEVLKTIAALGNCRVYPLLESPEALLNAFPIAMASPRVAALAFGAEDFAAEMGIVRTADEIELLYARSSLVAQARAAGRDSLDSPCLEFREPRRMAASARRARNLGFTGKLAIHPAQIRTLNKIFSPSERELKAARDVVAAASASTGAFSIDGSMVDEAVLKRARRVLRIADLGRGKGDVICT